MFCRLTSNQKLFFGFFWAKFCPRNILTSRQYLCVWQTYPSAYTGRTLCTWSCLETRALDRVGGGEGVWRCLAWCTITCGTIRSLEHIKARLFLELTSDSQKHLRQSNRVIIFRRIVTNLPINLFNQKENCYCNVLSYFWKTEQTQNCDHVSPEKIISFYRKSWQRQFVQKAEHCKY